MKIENVKRMTEKSIVKKDKKLIKRRENEYKKIERAIKKAARKGYNAVTVTVETHGFKGSDAFIEDVQKWLKSKGFEISYVRDALYEEESYNIRILWEK